MALRALFLAICLGFAAQISAAQISADQSPTATLVADSLQIDADGRLIADGSVEVFFDGTRMTASRVEFDRTTDRLVIAGPIRLDDGSGNVFLAEAAELDSALTEGLLVSARFVLDQQLQLAASEIARTGGRYTRLRRVAASSCEVCEGQTPLWEIRASGVVHDQLERQLYFSNAQLRVAGVPIFYVPRLRLPDPTLDRATGFLIPSVRTTNQLGTGLKVPYFIRVSDRSDLTFTPYLSNATTTLETRYRLAFVEGNLTLAGAYTDADDILGGQDRGYLFLRSDYRLPGDYRLRFDAEFVTDRAYGLDYGYFEKDRLDSELSISRTQRDDYLRAGLTYYETLREADIGIENTLPRNVGEVVWTHRLPMGDLGGDAWISLDAITLTRPSTVDGVGRDVSRVGADFDWRKDWVIPSGLLVETTAGARFDAYSVDDDSTFNAAPTRAVTRAGVTLRWPFQRAVASGGQQLLEPVAQLAWSDMSGNTTPNEDSLLVELDEGNLFSFSRYPGEDRVEEGLRANLGVSWRHRAASGTTIGITAGRIVRFGDPDAFAEGTGLSGDASDWLTAVNIRRDNRYSFINRALFDDTLEFTRNETRADVLASWGSLSTSYIWAIPVPEENRPERLSEWSLAADYGFDRNWRGQMSWRYDFAANRAASAGLGLRYTNECVDVDLSLSRRFTSSDTVSPTTDFGISVSLTGFGTGAEARSRRRSCGG